MNKEKIIKNLNNLDFKPSEEWHNQTFKLLETYSQSNVTKNNLSRNSILRVFKLLFNKNMSGTAIALLVTLLVAGGSAGTAVAANASGPGDTLYPLDQKLEDIRRSTIKDDEKLSKFEMKLLEERVDELKKMQQKGKDENISQGTKELLKQQERVRETVRNMENNPKIGEQKKKEVSERYEKVNQDNSDELNEIKEVYQKGNNDKFASEITDTVKKYQGNSNLNEANGEKEGVIAPPTDTETESKQGNQQKGKN